MKLLLIGVILEALVFTLYKGEEGAKDMFLVVFEKFPCEFFS